MWNSAATCAIGRPLASTWSTARRLPTAVSGALRWVMERVSSQQMNGFSTTHRAGQGPVPSSPLRDYNVMTRNSYANWVRRIHLVTDGQVPHWLDADHPRITVIDHADLLGGSRFNSHAIESALHRIPGLAEHYLYLNDDVFFGRIAYPGDFFPAPGLAAFFPSDLPIDPGPVSAQDLPIMAAAKNGRALLAARFGL